MSKRVYLSAADRQMESFQDGDAFDRSLLLNTLFQSGILVPDIYFAISGGIESHLQSPSCTLLEACIAEGIVVPSFREPSISSFTGALKHIREQELQGVRKSAEHTMERLQRSADGNGFAKVSPWTKLGIAFSERLKVLQQQRPPLVGPTFGFNMSQGHLQRFWDLTELWRNDVIEIARTETVRRFGSDAGVRRGEVLNALASKLSGLSGSGSVQVDDVASLLSEHPNRPELRVFLQWICEIYGYNQAVELGAIPNFSAYNQFSPVCLGTETASPPSLASSEEVHCISETVSLPPVNILKRIAPKDLLAVRNDLGYEYFTDLEIWHKDPGGPNKETQLRKSLRGYAKALVKRSATEPKGAVSVLLSSLPPRWRTWAKLAGGASLAPLAQWSPTGAAGLVTFVSAMDRCYAIYQWHDQRPEEECIELFAPKLTEANFST